MYKLSDKESTYIFVKCSLPIAWLALSNKSGNEITEDLVKRAYAIVSCRNPLLRALHKPEVEEFALVVRDTDDVIQDETTNKLPAHVTKEFHTREEAWAEYKKEVEYKVWESNFMWEVLVCVLDKESPSSDTNCVIFGHFNHGVADGAAVMAALSEFIKALNYGLTNNTLPPHNLLGDSLPVPHPFLERYPLFKFDDPTSDEEKEELFTKVNAKLNSEGGRPRGTVVDRMFTEEATHNFIAKCKRHGVTVTAGFYAAAAMVTSAKRVKSSMPVSYRTKETLGEIAVSFTGADLALDLTSTLAGVEGEDEETVWAALAKEFHREIHKKLELPEEKYKGMALGFVRPALNGPRSQSNTSILKGPDSDELSVCLSNVGILDKYFGDDGHLTVTDVTGYCSNHVSQVLTWWCYTFRGRFRFATLDIAYTPRKEVFEKFVNKLCDFIEKN